MYTKKVKEVTMNLCREILKAVVFQWETSAHSVLPAAEPPFFALFVVGLVVFVVFEFSTHIQFHCLYLNLQQSF